MSEQLIRTQLVNLITAAQAHMTFEDAVKNFPAAGINTCPQGVEYTFWHVLEHLRICQWDVLDYCINPNHQRMEWPRQYWPARDAVTDATGWQKTIDQFRADQAAFVTLVENPQTDLYNPIPYSHNQSKHTILYEVLDAADHNAYHIGEFAILRQVMGYW